MKVCKNCGSDAVTNVAFLLLNAIDQFSDTDIYFCDICSPDDAWPKYHGIEVVDKEVLYE